jgi:uncharacterized membrane protein
MRHFTNAVSVKGVLLIGVMSNGALPKFVVYYRKEREWSAIEKLDKPQSELIGRRH